MKQAIECNYEALSPMTQYGPAVRRTRLPRQAKPRTTAQNCHQDRKNDKSGSMRQSKMKFQFSPFDPASGSTQRATTGRQIGDAKNSIALVVGQFEFRR
jgi:hypothetical protein